MKLLLATRSRHKAEEVRRILEGFGGIQLLTLDDVAIPEDAAEGELEPYESFEENAASKADYFSKRSGMATVADDSGLEVEALGGAPGVRTKRFAPPDRYPGLDRDEANNQHLIECLASVPSGRRQARYVCVASLVVPEAGLRRDFRGEAPGTILSARRGVGGFGYDPIFFDEELGCSFAELRPEQKNERSHRGKAFRALGRFLASP